MLAELEAQVARIKSRAAIKAAKEDPAFRYIFNAIRKIDLAASATDDQPVRVALEEARATLSACMGLKGLAPSSASTHAEVDPESLLAFVKKNPGQRGEHIAAGMKTDTRALRRSMKKLIEAGHVKTKGERRGTQYWAA